MYQYLAGMGLKLARAIGPSKLKKVGQYVSKKTRMQDKAVKYAAQGKKTKAKAIQHLDAFGRKAYKGYGAAYKATLGSPTRRKVTSAALGGMAVGSFLSGDDID